MGHCDGNMVFVSMLLTDSEGLSHVLCFSFSVLDATAAESGPGHRADSPQIVLQVLPFKPVGSVSCFYDSPVY